MQKNGDLPQYCALVSLATKPVPFEIEPPSTKGAIGREYVLELVTKKISGKGKGVSGVRQGCKRGKAGA